MSNSLTKEIEAALNIEGRTLLVTIGNSFRGDDGVGPFIGEKVQSKENFKVINAESTPENIVSEAVDFRPDKIIIIDAANFGGATGEIRVIPLEKVAQYSCLSTHNLPLHITFGIIIKDTGATLTIVAVQGKKMDYEEKLSPEVETSALNLIEYFNKI
ncbi:MAG: hydrogenase maturation protease [Elusimicrobiales bacterium]|nr:hydrogenase maturation protease [Elusimicrobiales bacterium]MCK5106543.1 hydrogenase maturation protease [Elusimicrobiales bacterium]MCK5356943.1 hydrogenase maturation protease [Elusimicrobiales bacterium]